MKTALVELIRRHERARRVAQILYVAVSVTPTAAYLRDTLRNARAGTYRVRRTGQSVHVRPLDDLQVTSEFVSRRGYDIDMLLPYFRQGAAPPVVLDAGANIGLFTLDVARVLTDARVIAVEPDVENLRLLERNVEINGLEGRVDVHRVAAATSAGTLRFATGLRHVSRAADLVDDLDAPVIEVPTADFFALAFSADLVKLDIEGGEWPILRDSRFKDLGASVVVMEWHTRGSGVADAHAEALRLLRDAGYEPIVDDFNPPTHETAIGDRVGTVCAVRRQATQASPASSESP